MEVDRLHITNRPIYTGVTRWFTYIKETYFAHDLCYSLVYIYQNQIDLFCTRHVSLVNLHISMTHFRHMYYSLLYIYQTDPFCTRPVLLVGFHIYQIDSFCTRPMLLVGLHISNRPILHTTCVTRLFIHVYIKQTNFTHDTCYS